MTKKSSDLLPSKAPSHRQKRVAEEIRHILSQAILRGELPTESLRDQSITITDVSVSPDLRYASIWVVPLGGGPITNQPDPIVSELKAIAPFLRHYLAKNIRLKFVPELKFFLDDRLERERHLDQIFSKITPPPSE